MFRYPNRNRISSTYKLQWKRKSWRKKTIKGNCAQVKVTGPPFRADLFRLNEATVVVHFLEPAHLELRPVSSGVGCEQAVQRWAGPTLPAQPGQQAADLAVPLRAGFRLPRQFDGGENGLEDGGRDVVISEDGGQQVQQLCPCQLSNIFTPN